MVDPGCTNNRLLSSVGLMVGTLPLVTVDVADLVFSMNNICEDGAGSDWANCMAVCSMS